MARVFLRTTLKNKEGIHSYEGNGMKRENSFSYLEEGIQVIFKQKNQEVHLTRKNNEFSLHLIFREGKETKGNIQILEFRKKLDLQIHTNMLEWDSLGIHINYDLKVGDELENYDYQLRCEG